MEKLYKVLAGLIEARANCERSGNIEWHVRHHERLHSLVRHLMPRGSGFDNGTKLDIDRSTAERLVFTASFHHMNGDGYYDGWTDHEIIVTPSLHHGIKLRITGRDRDGFKDFVHEVFHTTLATEIDVAGTYKFLGVE